MVRFVTRGILRVADLKCEAQNNKGPPNEKTYLFTTREQLFLRWDSVDRN